ncbi:MAG: YceI family protein [Bacteroidota bacterium]
MVDIQGLRVMMRKLIVLFMGFFLIASLYGQEINSEKSIVRFSIKNMGLNTVKGSLKNMTGTANFNASQPEESVFDVCMSTSTIDTGNKKRDEHLKNADFFNVFKFPDICFTSTEVKKAETGFIAIGDLTMCGVTKSVEIPFRMSKNTLVGDLSLKRFDFGLGQSTGSFFAGNEVNVSIVCSFE